MVSSFMSATGTRKVHTFLWLPGLLLVLGGALILIAPMILVWFIGGTAIVLGLLLRFSGFFMRKMMLTRTGPSTRGTDSAAGTASASTAECGCLPTSG